jgi:hypothetical protein
MKSEITYRLFYWIPNTLSSERIAVGLCLFDQSRKYLDTWWIAQKELTRLTNVFAYSNKADAKDALSLLSEIKDEWKSKAFDPQFWSTIARYWNGIIQISEAKKIIYAGTKGDFTSKSAMLSKRFLPLANIKKNRNSGRPKDIVKYFVEEVRRKDMQNRVSLGTKIPPHGKYRLLQPMHFLLRYITYQPFKIF